MKTILYLDHTSKMGGGEIALLNLVIDLDKTRYTPVVVLATEGPLADKLKAAHIETHVIPLDSKVLDMRKDSLGVSTLLKMGKVFGILNYAVKLSKWARNRQVDLIHTNSLKADLYGGVAGRLSGIPVLWHIRDNISSDYLPGIVAKAFRLLARVIPNAIVANSQSTLKTLQLSNNKNGLNDVVYSCHISGTRFADSQPQKSEIHETNPNPVIALVGRITPWKGQDIFLKAGAIVVKKYPSAKFWIVGAPLFGEIDYEQELHDLTDGLGVRANVEFLGFRNDIPTLLEDVDIVAHASTVGEPFGQVVIEGMAAGKPVVGTDGGALPEIVIPGVTGLLVPMADAPAMADAFLNLLSDPAGAHRMGAAGRERVIENFTLEHTSAKMKIVYDNIFGKLGKPDTKSNNKGLANIPTNA